MSSLRKRAENIYKSKLANYMKSVKELSSVPKIDSLSKKIAQIVTSKELEVLGIQPSENLPKKVFYTIPNKDPENIQYISTIIPNNLDEVDPSSNNIHVKLQFSDKEKFEENIKYKESNLNHKKIIKALPLAELEFGICDAREFNSIKNAETEKTEKNVFACSLENNQDKSIDYIKPNNFNSIDSKINLKPYSIDNLSNHFNETKNFSNNTFSKASFLHSAQNLVPSAIPRCHINLPGNQSSPVYYNVRVKKEAKIKTINGLGPANSLRRQLLESEEIKQIEKNDFDSRNERWVRMKKEKLKKLEEDRKMKELEDFSQNCTFDPKLKRGKNEKNNSRFNYSLNLSRPSFIFKGTEEKEVEVPKKAQNVYIGLSPSNKEIRYLEGCNTEKIFKLGKSLISYI